MSGRIEKETLAKTKMQYKLSGMPEIFTTFYNWLDARDRSYTTMRNYIRHVNEFMVFFTS